MFQVSSVMFASGHLTSLLTLGVNTGLVMDVGYTETLVVPVSLFLCLFVWFIQPLQHSQLFWSYWHQAVFSLVQGRLVIKPARVFFLTK